MAKACATVAARMAVRSPGKIRGRGGDLEATLREAEAHQADRFLHTAATGAGDPGHRHRDGGARAGQGALGHGAHDFFADRAVTGDEFGRNADKLGLRCVGVGHEAAVHHVGRAGDGGQRRGDQTAGAAFRGGASRTPRTRQASSNAAASSSKAGEIMRGAFGGAIDGSARLTLPNIRSPRRPDGAHRWHRNRNPERSRPETAASLPEVACGRAGCCCGPTSINSAAPHGACWAIR